MGGFPGARYLHQLPPVLPRNSFFSEFQMNFFQLPSSLARPRAMPAAQTLLLRLLRGRGVRKEGRCGGSRRGGCGSASVDDDRRPRGGGRGGGGEEEEEGRGASSGRLQAPHLLARRGLLGGPGEEQQSGGLGEIARAMDHRGPRSRVRLYARGLARSGSDWAEELLEARAPAQRHPPKNLATSPGEEKELRARAPPALYSWPRRRGPRPLAARRANRRLEGRVHCRL